MAHVKNINFMQLKILRFKYIKPEDFFYTMTSLICTRGSIFV